MRAVEGNGGALQASLVTDAADELAAVEALLFTSGEPLELKAIAQLMGWNVPEARDRVQALAEQLAHAQRGIQVQWHDGRVALATAPRFGGLLQRFYQVERTVRLSEAALETLAVVAFQQPVTRAEIEAVRGVDSTGVLSTLIARELVEVGGRRSAPGSPLEYRTTEAFLQRFGLAALEELSTGEAESDLTKDGELYAAPSL